MRKEGIEAYSKGNGGAFVNVQAKGQLFQFELSYSDVEKWADLYDEAMEQARIQEMRDTDPWVVLEEIARIFHYRGWDLGDGSVMDMDFIKSSDDYLMTVYQAFNPIHKK